MTREPHTDRSLGVDYSSAPATGAAKNRSITAQNPDLDSTRTARNKRPVETWRSPCFNLRYSAFFRRWHYRSRSIWSGCLEERHLLDHRHTSSTCYAATGVCDTIGPALTGDTAA
ncbi:MAG: hypothetical protein IH987_01030 [Planctomycetes bacterium]|nr:hypothetical protein [Planctomycetota bacterium]